MVAVPITPGMTEWAVAQQYGVSVAAVEAANSYAPTDLPVGGTLIVPSGGSYSSWTPARDGDGDSDGDSSDAPQAPVQSAPVQAPVQQAQSPITSTNTAPPGSFQACVIQRESGGNSQVMNSSGHYGLYQFSSSAWAEGGGNPADFGNASVSEQNQVFQHLYAVAGTSPWAPYDGC